MNIAAVVLGDAPAANPAGVYMELGAAVLGLALLARLAQRFGISTIPLYLIGGLAFGNGGLVPLRFTAEFVHIGAEIGVILLLFMLGLEYTGSELAANLRTGLPAGGADFFLNFTPGVVAGWLLGWSPLAAILLGGATYVSSSGIIARVLAELRWNNNPETPVVLTVLVLEDLAMAVFLPLVAVLLIGQGVKEAAISVGIALLTVTVILFVAIRYGLRLSNLLLQQTDESVLLSVFGLVLLVGGICERLQVSAAVGAFLVGIALSGTAAKKAHVLIGPLRDLFAALFFLFFGLEIDPASLVPFLLPAGGLAVATALTKILTGWWAASRAKMDRSARLRAGAILVTRGEFSIVVAGLGMGAGIQPDLGPFAAAYVLLLAVFGPLLARGVGRFAPVEMPATDPPK
jgi:CPA2 family monovalent cation:H+ antiporter-2